jgi:hypothetical protein
VSSRLYAAIKPGRDGAEGGHGNIQDKLDNMLTNNVRLSVFKNITNKKYAMLVMPSHQWFSISFWWGRHEKCKNKTKM